MFVDDLSIAAVKDLRADLPIRFDERAASVSLGYVRICECAPDFVWRGRDIDNRINAWFGHNGDS